MTEAEIGKEVTVEVTSSVETGTLQGKYSGTVQKQTSGGEDPAELTGTVTVKSSRTGEVSYPGDTLTATIANSNNSGNLHYQWFAGKTAIAGATKETY